MPPLRKKHLGHANSRLHFPALFPSSVLLLPHQPPAGATATRQARELRALAGSSVQAAWGPQVASQAPSWCSGRTVAKDG